ncbi:MAG: hypothetical protein VCC00_13940 [Deltaproteobacteria bacterium]
MSAQNAATKEASRDRPDAALLLVLAFATYWLTNDGGFMVFNYHLHLAVAFLEGRTWISNPPSWLTEFAWANDRAYIYYDPFPAVFLMPLARWGGLDINLARVSLALGAINIALLRLLLGQIGVRRSTANATALLFAFGTVHFYAAEYGNTWLFAHLLANGALTLAFLEATGRKNAFLTGLLCTFAATSRSPTLLAAPIFLFLLWRHRPQFRTLFEFGLPFVVAALLLAIYNFARFGDVLDNGYLSANQALFLPEHGSFHWRYIGKNLQHYFLLLPSLQREWPFLVTTDHGLGLVATTPAVLLLLRQRWSETAPDAALLGRLSLAGMGLIFGLYLFYFWDGWRQFGSRYTLDFSPFLMVALALKNDPRTGMWRWPFPLLIGLSIAINGWGIWYWKSFLS